MAKQIFWIELTRRQPFINLQLLRGLNFGLASIVNNVDIKDNSYSKRLTSNLFNPSGFSYSTTTSFTIAAGGP